MNIILSLSRSLAIASVGLLTLGLISTPASHAEKGAVKLPTVTTAQDLSKIEPGDTVLMSCPKCKDTFATVVDKSFKGKADETTGLVHLCPSCDTRVVFSGQGKGGPEDKLVHTCKMCGSTDVSCCVLKKGGAKTEGMEMK